VLADRVVLECGTEAFANFLRSHCEDCELAIAVVQSQPLIIICGLSSNT
jgi:hypothetical protein